MMKLKGILCSLLLGGLLLGSTACVVEEIAGGSSGNPAASKSYISLSIRAASGTINQDTKLWEDRVTEVRMLVFDQTGFAVFNGMLSFPKGFSDYCAGVQINPGIYDFYFIANETVYPDFAKALASITSVSQFTTDTRFRRLQYHPDFVPDGTTSGGRFVSAACYKKIAINQGGTEANPVPVPLPTSQVELVRSLAKVEVTFRKKVPGSNIPAGSVSSVQLQNVAQYITVPPADNPYADQTTVSNHIVPDNFNYGNDSIGQVTFYIPEFLNLVGGTGSTQLYINNIGFPVQTDDGKIGLIGQRRNINPASLSDSCVIRNYYYQINAYISTQGGVQLKVCVNPWNTASYTYMFQDPGQTLVIPPVQPTDSSVIVPTDCGKIEIRSNNEILNQGLQGAYGDIINYWDPAAQGPSITKGKPPYYCEKKYGPGWRLINSCELMSFLALFDQTYKIWQSNTWQGIGSNLPLYSIPFRQQAQDLLAKLTGASMSGYTMSDTQGGDNFGSAKLGMLDAYFTPGDIMVTLNQYPNGWTYPSPPFSGIESWFPMEVVLQLKGYWYSGYLDYTNPANYNKILYQQFQRYTYSSTVSRCVRSVE